MIPTIEAIPMPYVVPTSCIFWPEYSASKIQMVSFGNIYGFKSCFSLAKTGLQIMHSFTYLFGKMLFHISWILVWRVQANSTNIKYILAFYVAEWCILATRVQWIIYYIFKIITTDRCVGVANYNFSCCKLTCRILFIFLPVYDASALIFAKHHPCSKHLNLNKPENTLGPFKIYR